MKIALATDGKNLEAEVTRHFGWGRNYLIYDTKTKKFEIYPNPEDSGKKELPPELLNRLGVNVVIVFSLGPKAFDRFKRFGIKLYEAIDKSIAENIKEFQKGNLSSLEEKNPFIII